MGQNVPTQLASAKAEKNLSTFPFLKHLAAREAIVRNGKLSTIIFIRDRNPKGQEISGYIDYHHRLKIENFEPYFERKKRLLPRPSDLSSTIGTHCTPLQMKVPTSRSFQTTKKACSSKTNVTGR